MITNNKYIIPTSNGLPIVADITYDTKKDNLPIIIFCHGYKGFKDWGAWHLVAKKIAEAGFFFLKFNFSHNGGTPEQPIDFPDLEAFGRNSFTLEIEDIGTVIDFLHNKNPFTSHLNKAKLSLIGHSRGGGMAIIRTSIDNRISKLITWAGIAEIERRFPQGLLLEKWKKDGIRYVLNGRTEQEMPHYYSFYEDYLNNKTLLNIEKATKNIVIPQLIINGTLDKAVKPEEARLIQSWNNNAELLLISKAGHTFGAKHPWEEEKLPYFLNEVVQKTIEFISKN